MVNPCLQASHISQKWADERMVEGTQGYIPTEKYFSACISQLHFVVLEVFSWSNKENLF